MAEARPTFRRTLAWSLGERYAGLAINFVGLVALARLLGPDQFGLYAIAAGLAALAIVIRDFGLTGWIVQDRSPTEERLRTAATLGLLLGSALAVLLVLLAPLAGSLYGDPRLVPVVRVTAVGFLLTPLSLVPMAMLAREQRFAALFAIQTVAAMAGTAVAILAALGGLGAMSPALGTVATSAIILAGAWSCWPPWRVLRPHLAHWREIAGFSGYAMGAGLLAEAGRVVPAMLVGRTLGVEAAGLLNRGQAVSLLFQKAILHGTKRAALPALAKGHREGMDLADAFRAKVAMLAAVSWPAAVLFVTLAGPIVALVLGPGWEGAVPVVRILSLALLVLPLTALNNEFFVAHGQVKLQLWVEVLAQTTRIVLVIAAAGHSVPAVAAAMVASRLVTMLVSTHLALCLLGCGASSLRSALGRSLAPAAGAGLGPLAVWATGLAGAGPPPAVLAVAGGISAVGVLLGLYLTDHPLRAEIDRLRRTVRREGAN